ncbi:MAG: hypothetical protein ACREQ9_21180 [Candidatus Binatia bacterium]
MDQVRMLGKRVELVVHLKDQVLRLRQGEKGTVTGVFRDGFNVPLQVAWDNGINWSVHWDEIRVIDEIDGKSQRASAT